MAGRENTTSLDLAYDVAINSFEPTIKRLDRKDDQIAKLMFMSVGLLGVVMGTIKTHQMDIASCWAYLIYLLFAAQTGVALLGRFKMASRKIIGIPEIKNLYDRYDALDLKRLIVKDSATAFENNDRIIKTKLTCLIWMAIILISQALVLIVWVAFPEK